MVKSNGVHSSPASSGSSGQGPRLLGWRSVENTWGNRHAGLCKLSREGMVHRLSYTNILLAGKTHTQNMHGNGRGIHFKEAEWHASGMEL